MVRFYLNISLSFHGRIVYGLGKKQGGLSISQNKETMNQSRFIVLICSLFLLSLFNNVHCYIGINWGRSATQRILPAMVVDLFLQNGIREVKIFSPSVNLLPAFVGTNIGVTVSLPNDDLSLITNVDTAKDWINNKLVRYMKQGLILRNIAVGTQPFSKKSYGGKVYYHAVEVLDYMQTAIDELHIGNGTVKAITDVYLDVFNKGSKPSEATFSEDVRDVIIRAAQILVKNNAPIWIGMFPLYSAKTLFVNDTEFAFFDNNSTSHFVDKGYAYDNVFDVVYDMFVCAFEREGFPNIKIGIGQIGWPTDGIIDGNIENAERFNKGLIRRITSGKGTPRRPGAGPIDTFLHNLADENSLKILSGGERRGWNRHWGIYRFDGKPKYRIDFSGQDRDIQPYSAIGVTHMPNRWCVFNKGSNDTAILSRLILDACQKADCTSLERGGSCGTLSFVDQISYAFNVYFQEKSQKFSESGCDFEGLGSITSTNPSTGTCTFPVEILSAEFVSDRSNTLVFSPAMTGLCIFLCFFIFFHW